MIERSEVKAPVIFYKPDDTEWVNSKVMPPIRRELADKKGYLPVTQMFPTIEGEGLHIGTPRFFVRLGGCGIGCRWCDSSYTFGIKNSTIYKVEDLANFVIEETRKAHMREVSITGGEPMLYPEELRELVILLRRSNLHVSLETSGMILDSSVFQFFNYISLDIKTPNSGVYVSKEHILYITRSAKAHSGVQLKAVVENMSDLYWLEDNCAHFLDGTSLDKPLILTPGSPEVTEKTDRLELIAHWQKIYDMIQDWNKGYNIRIVPQIHKIFSWE